MLRWLNDPIQIPQLLFLISAPYLVVAALNLILHSLAGRNRPPVRDGLDIRFFHTLVTTILHGTVWLLPIVAPFIFLFYSLVTLGWILPRNRAYSRGQIVPMYFINASLMLLLPRLLLR